MDVWDLLRLQIRITGRLVEKITKFYTASGVVWSSFGVASFNLEFEM